MCMYVGHLAGLERWIRYKKNLKVQNRVIMHVIRLITCGPGARIGPTRPSPPRDGWSTRQGSAISHGVGLALGVVKVRPRTPGPDAQPHAASPCVCASRPAACCSVTR